MGAIMKNMTLEHIAQACGGTYIGEECDRKKEIQGAVIDSRLVGEGYLFIPIRGARVDGHDFIPAVFEKGALAVLSEQRLEHPAGPYILVDSTEEAMKKIAAFYRRSLDIKVVGITGSVGKTSTKEMIASVLSEKYRVLKTEGNLNNEIGLPLTIFKIREEHQVAVLEMGISEFGEMHRLAEMAQPDICVITNIGLCHLENLITRDGILKAKTESFEHLAPDGIAILNGDDDKLCDKKMVNGRPAVFYGIGQEAKTAETETGSKRLAEKEVYATDVEAIGLEGTKAVIHTPEQQFEVVIPIAGEHNVYNALAAVCVARRLGLDAEEMKLGIEHAHTIGGLGDMGELGSEEKKLHGMVGTHFAGKKIDALFVTGTLAGEIAEEARRVAPETRVYAEPDKEALEEALLDCRRPGDTILVKASHFMGFSEIVKKLEQPQ